MGELPVLAAEGLEAEGAAVIKWDKKQKCHVDNAGRPVCNPTPLPELLDEMADATESAGVTDGPFPKAFKRLKGTAKSVACLKADNPGVGIKSLEGCCCCNCRYHHEDHSHPLTDGGIVTHIRGWICGGSEVGYYSEWGEHGLCECHELQKEKP